MRTGLRRAIVFLLAITLIAGGMPLSNAMACDPVTQGAEMAHPHHDMQMAGARHGHGDDQPAAHHHDHRGATSNFDLCRCLNCGMCTTPGIAVLAPDVMLERRSLPASFQRFATEHPIVLMFVDPGIPIATA